MSDGNNRFLKLLQRSVQKDASDIHLKTGSVPYYRIDGDMTPASKEILGEQEMQSILKTMLSSEQRAYLNKRGEVDLAFTEKGIGRFRVNAFRQRGTASIVMRRIKSKILSFQQLFLPPQIDKLTELVRGLVLITGTTGSGKSTTLAAVIDAINQSRKCHIVTIEDPIEFIHQDKKGVVNQREIAIDTKDFGSALKSVMRQDPDVILVGEMRDLETFQAAISASETGHLVFSTLHTTNITQTIDRIVDLFPTTQHDQVRSALSMNLKAIMCMRLLPRKDGAGRVPMCEFLFATPIVRRLIKDDRVLQLDMAIQQGKEEGMLGFNESIHDLIKSDMISFETGMEISENPEELDMMLQGIRLNSMKGGILK